VKAFTISVKWLNVQHVANIMGTKRGLGFIIRRNTTVEVASERTWNRSQSHNHIFQNSLKLIILIEERVAG